MLFTHMHESIFQTWSCIFISSCSNWGWIVRANIWRTGEDCGVLKFDGWSCVNSDYSLVFQPQSVSNFYLLCVCGLRSALFMKRHHVRHILLSSHPNSCSGFLLSKSRACVDACCRFQVCYANVSHKAKACLLKRNLWLWQLWCSWMF